MTNTKIYLNIPHIDHSNYAALESVYDMYIIDAIKKAEATFNKEHNSSIKTNITKSIK